jgi:predicted small lipoprotein YifL
MARVLAVVLALALTLTGCASLGPMFPPDPNPPPPDFDRSDCCRDA